MANPAVRDELKPELRIVGRRTDHRFLCDLKWVLLLGLLLAWFQLTLEASEGSGCPSAKNVRNVSNEADWFG